MKDRVLFFLELTITSNIFVDILEDFIMPQTEDSDVTAIRLCTPHFALTVRESLDTNFPGRWIGKRGLVPCLPGSPDLPLTGYLL
jgi:hypothetical protein